MSKNNDKTRHLALMRLRSLCGLTAESFSRATGIGYAQLVAVEQGRRELSPGDALQVSAATGVDPSFNDDKSKRDIMAIWGLPYDEQSLSLWTNQELPDMRKSFRALRNDGELDPFEEVATSNALEMLAAARVQGKDIAVSNAIKVAFDEICERFGLRVSLAKWKSFQIEYNAPEKLSEPEQSENPDASYKQSVNYSVQTVTGEVDGRSSAEDGRLLAQRKERAIQTIDYLGKNEVVHTDETLPDGTRIREARLQNKVTPDASRKSRGKKSA